MADKRTLVAALAGAVLVVCLGVSVWLVVRPNTSDCRVANEMLNYSMSENDRLVAVALAHPDDRQQVLAAYQARADKMYDYAAKIRAPGLRAKAQAVAELDKGIANEWSAAMRQSSPSSVDSTNISQRQQRFLEAYEAYAAQHDEATRDLQAACPNGS